MSTKAIKLLNIQYVNKSYFIDGPNKLYFRNMIIKSLASKLIAEGC